MKQNSPPFCWLLLPIFLIATGFPGRGAMIYLDESQFTNALTAPDDYGLATDPGLMTGTNYTSETVTASHNGNAYSTTVEEGVFDTSSGVPAAVSSLTTGSTFRYETDASQGGASVGAWGFDSEGTSSSGNAFFLFDFSGSSTAVNSVSLTTADWEGGNGRSAYVALYDTSGSLLTSSPLDFPSPAYGDGTTQFLGLGLTAAEAASASIGYLAIFVGDDDPGGTGSTERLAFGELSFGLSTIPEPGSLIFLLVGMGALLGRRRVSLA